MMMYISSIEIETVSEISVLNDFRPEVAEATDFLQVMSGWI